MRALLAFAVAATLLTPGHAHAQQAMDFSKPDDEEAARPSGEVMLRAAVNQHELARTHKAIGRLPKAEIEQMFDNAVAAYDRFIAELPDDPENGRAMLAKARAQRDIGKDAAAAVTCIKLRDKAGEVPERLEAAMCAVYAYQTALETARKEGTATAPTDAERAAARANGKPLTIPEPVRRLLDAMSYFLSSHPSFAPDPEVRARIAYLSGDMLASYGRREDARRHFFKVFDYRPAKDVADAAAEELLSVPREKQDWDQFLAVLDMLKGATLTPETETDAFRERVEKNRAGVRYGKVGELLKAEQWDAAVTLAEEILEADPKGTEAPKILYNMAYSLDKLDRKADALAAYARVAREYPKHELAAQALLSQGRLAKELSRPDEAITAWRTFAERYPKAEQAPEALLAAADLLAQDSRLAEAAELLDRYSKNARGQDARATQVLKHAGDFYEKTGNAKKALQRYEGYLSGAEAAGEPAEERVRVAARAGLLAERLGKKPVAKRHFTEAVTIARKNGVSSEWSERASAKLGGM